MRSLQPILLGRTGTARGPVLCVLLSTTLLLGKVTGTLGEGPPPEPSATNFNIRVKPPKIFTDGRGPQPLIVRGTQFLIGGEEVREGPVYLISLEREDLTYEGKYGIEFSPISQGSRKGVLVTSRLTFEEPLPVDLTVTQAFEIGGDRQVGGCCFPTRSGAVKEFDSDGQRSTAAHFVLGKRAATRQGPELAMPVIDVRMVGVSDRSLALAADPYHGAQFDVIMPADGDDALPRLSVTTTYTGSIVPVEQERRLILISSHDYGIEGMFDSFYDTIPEIEPGSPWIHEIQLNYYDYLSDGGEGWFADLEELARRIPKPLRGSVVANIHGWYDYLGRYSFDRETGQLENDWVAFPRTRKTRISLEEIERRIGFAKDLGFRVVLYFADGLNADSGGPGFREDWLIRDESGNPQSGWTGPSTGSTFVMDPSHREVRDFFLDYADAILERFGRQIDGLVWDETLYIAQERLSWRDGKPAHADRDFMTLVAALVGRVQEFRKTNPDLVFLTSDCLGASPRGLVPYALVSHGTYQDTACRPECWAPGLAPNYRNCLWSCNWHPITEVTHNRIAAEEYGLPQGLSNGYAADVGPAEMSEQLLDEVIRLFLKRAAEGGRKRYLTGEVPLNPALAPLCTTEEDAVGGCDGVKTGTWGFCTEKEINPWWQVDLGAAKRIETVLVFNRCDGDVEDRAARLVVLLSLDAKTWTEHYRHDGTPFLGFTDGKPLEISLDGPPARYLRIQLPQEDYLHLDEVEVRAVGDKANLALGRPADQSSVSRWSVSRPATAKEAEDE